MKELKAHLFPNDIEWPVININVKKKKWLIFRIYCPPNQCKRDFDRNWESNGLSKYRLSNILVMGDFNSVTSVLPDCLSVAAWQGGPGGPWPPQRTFSKGRQSLRGAPKTL